MLIAEARASLDGDQCQLHLILNHELLASFYPQTDGRLAPSVERHIRRLLHTLPGRRPEWKQLTFSLAGWQ
jgi:hypothetical protein